MTAQDLLHIASADETFKLSPAPATAAGNNVIALNERSRELLARQFFTASYNNGANEEVISHQDALTLLGMALTR